MLIGFIVDGSYPLEGIIALNWGAIVISKLEFMDSGGRSLVFARNRDKVKSPPSIRYCKLTPWAVGGASFNIAAMYSKKQVSANTHPCLRPPVVGKGSAIMQCTN